MKTAKALYLARRMAQRRRQDGGGTDSLPDDQPQLEQIPKQPLPDYYPQSPQSIPSQVGQALQTAAQPAVDWYQSQPSWMQQASELEQKRETDPAGDLDRRIAFAQGMVGPQAGTLAGRLATGADLPALRAATAMEAQGVARGDIWNQTGWFRGPDKQWRWEISDLAAKPTANVQEGSYPTPRAMPDVFEHPELYRNYPSLQRTTGELGYGNRFGGGFTPATARSPANIELNAPQEVTPEMAASLGTGYGGSKPFDLRSGTLHELQHNVQNIERFSPGSNPQWLSFSGNRQMLGVLDQNARDNFGKSFFDLTKEEQFKLQAAVRAEWYMRSAGETEARNVQARANMTDAERWATPPWETLDRPEEQLRVSKPGPRSRTARQEGGAVDSAVAGSPDDQPKLERGQLPPATIDRHNMRLYDLKGSEPGVGYGYLEALEQEQARKMGLAMAQYQASGWLGGAEKTGVRSGNESFMQHFINAVNRTAEDKGFTPEHVLREFVRGKMYFVPRIRQAGGAVKLARRMVREREAKHH
jgi:hypothetical protein